MEREQDFNKGWKFCRLNADKETKNTLEVSLPHDAMILEKRSADSAGGGNISWFTGGDYSYSKTFFVPKDFREKCITFEFEGVYRNAEIYFNGNKAAFRPYGYTDFFVKADKYLKYGQENEIQVIAHNSDQPNSRWYTGSGIYRPVRMYVQDAEHILLNGVRIRTVSINPAVVEAEVCTTGAGMVKLEISGQDAGNKEKANAPSEEDTAAASVKKTDGLAFFRVKIPDARLWDCEHPYLYCCKISYIPNGQKNPSDCVTIPFGIRTLSWNEKKGLTINGERVILRGACIHHDNGPLGACAWPDAEERKIRILKENGYNAVRSAHNPCSKALLDACDRQGMLVMDEYVDMWYMHKTQYDYADMVMDWWKKDLKDMVRKDFNHPSVILYSTGNEVGETAQERGIRFTGQMTEYLHALDDTRPVTCGVNIFFNFLSSIGLGVYSDEKAKKEARNTKKKKPVGSEFYNTLAGIFGDKAMKLGATLRPCDIKTRDAFANMDIAGYNYGILRYRRDLEKYPDRLILGSETFCKDAYDFWEMAKKYPRIIGDFVWAGMDYMGEVGIGSWEYQDYAPDFLNGIGWITAGSGRIDVTGKPNGEALYTRVALEQERGPFLAVRPVYQKGCHAPSAWKMTDAMPSWSWRGCEGMQAEIEVYARAAEVELFLNGRSMGSMRLPNTCTAKFKIPYQSGELSVVSRDSRGREIGRDKLRTAGTEKILRAVPEKDTVRPDGLVFVRLQYTDAEGIVKPMCRNILTVEVKGGRLLGLANACSYNKIGYKENRTDTYYGEALAVVQSDGSGDVALLVTDGKLSGKTKVRLLR